MATPISQMNPLNQIEQTGVIKNQIFFTDGNNIRVYNNN